MYIYKSWIMYWFNKSTKIILFTHNICNCQMLNTITIIKYNICEHNRNISSDNFTDLFSFVLHQYWYGKFLPTVIGIRTWYWYWPNSTVKSYLLFCKRNYSNNVINVLFLFHMSIKKCFVLCSCWIKRKVSFYFKISTYLYCLF